MLNNENKNLYIVTTPFQLISALEAIFYFDTKNNILVVFDNKFENNSKQLSQLIDENKNLFIKVIRYEATLKTKFFKYLKLIFDLKKENLQSVFIGDTGSIQKVIISNLISKKIYLLDDGAKTILTHKKIIDNQRIFPEGIKLLRYKIFGLKINISQKIGIFTFFNLSILENYEIINHSFEYFKLKNNLKSKLIRNVVYILGQPLVENNRISDKAYENYLNTIIEKYKDSEIYYLMHRREEISNLNSYTLKKEIKIEESNVPGEIYFTFLDFIPEAIIGVNTTLLFSLNAIFDRINIYAYKFDKDDILRSENWFEEAIEYFQQNKIKILGKDNEF